MTTDSEKMAMDYAEAALRQRVPDPVTRHPRQAMSSASARPCSPESREGIARNQGPRSDASDTIGSDRFPKRRPRTDVGNDDARFRSTRLGP